MKHSKITLSFFLALTASSCATFVADEKVAIKKNEIEAEIEQIKEQPLYKVHKGSYAPYEAHSTYTPIEEKLAEKRLSFNGSGITFSEILKEFSDQDIQVMTTLESVLTQKYTGYEIKDVDAKTALDVLTANMGFDYILDSDASGKPVVQITGLQQESITLNVPDSSSGFSIVGGFGSGGSGGSSGQQSGSAGEQSSASGQQSGSSGQQSGPGGQQGASGGQQGGSSFGSMGQMTTYFASKSAFYGDLEQELEKQLVELRPKAKSQTQHQNAQNQSQFFTNGRGVSTGDYEESKIGSVAINPSTGKITVKAPRHIRTKIMSELRDLKERLNTAVILEARLYAVTSENRESKGINYSDLSEINSSRYNVFSDNTVSGNPAISVIDGLGGGLQASYDNAIGSAVFGIQDPSSTFRAFVNYLSEDSDVTMVDEITSTTYSGQSVQYSQMGENVTVQYSQSDTVTSEVGITGGGINSEILSRQTGIAIQFTPFYDRETDTFLTYGNVTLRLQDGTVQIPQIVIQPDGSIRNLSSDYTKIKDILMQANSISKNGQTVIFSSGTRTMEKTVTDGITKLKDLPIGGLVGKGNREIVYSKYYLLLNIRAVPHYLD